MTDKITIYDKKPVDKLTFADDGMFQEVPGKKVLDITGGKISIFCQENQSSTFTVEF